MPELRPTPYEAMGGEQIVHRLVSRFYELMDTMPEAYEIRKMHANDLSEATDKLFKFLSGWLGGPPLYENEYGHPRLRRRHLPFSIDVKERDQWLMCMYQAMEDIDIDKNVQMHLKQAFFQTADHMRNQ